MDHTYPNWGKVSARCTSQWATSAAALLDPSACAGLSWLCVGPLVSEKSFIFLWVQAWAGGAAGSPAAVSTARGVYISGAPWGSGGGNGTGAHSCFTGICEEAPLVTLSSAFLCSDSWPHGCSCSNIQTPWQCFSLKIRCVHLRFQICAVWLALSVDPEEIHGSRRDPEEMYL